MRRRFSELVGVGYLSVVGSAVGNEGVDELEQIASLLAAQGYGPDRIVIDPSVVRGLGYYTGPVFEAELTFEILDDKGRPRQFGSVAGGGRYDDLVKRFTGQSVPATGVSIGVDRLLAALRAKGRAGTDARRPRRRHRDGPRPHGRLHGHGRRPAPRGHPGRGLSRQPQELRQPAEIRRQARRRPSPSSRGRDEADKGTVILKDLILGAKIAESASLEEWKARPAQVEVPRADLVAAVRRMLGLDRCPTAPPSGPRPTASTPPCNATGAQPVEADILLPAGTLLDLYGEDIRARAYVTSDPIRGEMMLRPDFTVPVVQMHMAHGAEPARYCYRGEVFRKQDHVQARASEYLQVGYEVFARDEPRRRRMPRSSPSSPAFSPPSTCAPRPATWG